MCSFSTLLSINNVFFTFKTKKEKKDFFLFEISAGLIQIYKTIENDITWNIVYNKNQFTNRKIESNETRVYVD